VKNKIHPDTETGLLLFCCILQAGFVMKVVECEVFVQCFLFLFAEIIIVFSVFRLRYVKQFSLFKRFNVLS
jgi:hypothetical protein